MVDVDGRSVTVEIGTGAALSLISEATFKEEWGDRRWSLQWCSRVPTWETIPVVGNTRKNVCTLGVHESHDTRGLQDYHRLPYTTKQHTTV